MLFCFFHFFCFIDSPCWFFDIKNGKKTAESEWKGEIIDKLYRIKEERDEGSIIKNKKKASHFYTLVVQTDEGLTRKVAVSK